MAGERTYPVLAVPDLAEAMAFYEALGFEVVMRQERPNPYAVVGFEDLRIHLSGVAGIDPMVSLGNVIVVVPDAGALHAQFASGLRGAFGRVPSDGAPRLLRPRKKLGTVAGFSVVDTGGNWLRVYTAGGVEGDDDPAAGTLAHRIDAAARLGDGKDDPTAALRILELALARFDAAAPVDIARAQLYRAELACRIGDDARARTALGAATALSLSTAERRMLADEIAEAAARVDGH